MSALTERIHTVGGADASAKTALATTPPTITTKSK
jgi:hypothetical protein